MPGQHEAKLWVQLWSYNYDPEPTGIGIVSKVLAHNLRERGHRLEVIAAHPHYPAPLWGHRWLPYREVRAGIDVLRLPLWIGRSSAAERYRQELTYMAAQTLATPFLGRPEVLVSTSPSFPALLPAVLNVRARRLSWVLWLHDLLPDGATATGIVDETDVTIKLARRLEQLAYRAADRIVVPSRAFIDNLAGKGVDAGKIELIYAPSTRVPVAAPERHASGGALRILSMGNIGHSQGLTELVRAFEARPDLNQGTSLVVTGTGVAAGAADAEVISGRVQMLGLVAEVRLERELSIADVGFVSQRYNGSEFNIPSKLMNFMAYGLPILAAVNPAGEVARIVRDAKAGWVVDSGDPDSFPVEVARIARSPGEVQARAANARAYAREHFSQEAFATKFERMLRAVAGATAPSSSGSRSRA